jgi:glycine dehydrogenase subunit 2
MYELQEFLAAITGLDAVSLQPAAGAQGELAGMLIFAAWHAAAVRNADQDPDPGHRPRHQSGQRRPLRLQPVSGGRAQGMLDVQSVAELMDEETAGIMLTNPNTLGLFETISARLPKSSTPRAAWSTATAPT